MDAGELKQKKIPANHFRTIEVRKLTLTKSLSKAVSALVGGAQARQPDWHGSHPRLAIGHMLDSAMVVLSVEPLAV